MMVLQAGKQPYINKREQDGKRRISSPTSKMSLEPQNMAAMQFTLEQMMAFLAGVHNQNVPAGQSMPFVPQGFLNQPLPPPQVSHSGSPSPIYPLRDISHLPNQTEQQIQMPHQIDSAGGGYTSGTKRARLNSGSSEEGYRGTYSMGAETLLAIEQRIAELEEGMQFLRMEVQSQNEQIEELKASKAVEGAKSKAVKTKTDPKLQVSRHIDQLMLILPLTKIQAAVHREMLDLCGATYNNDKGKTYILPNPHDEARTISVPGQHGEPDTVFTLFNPEWLTEFKKSSTTRDYVDKTVLRVINNNKVSADFGHNWIDIYLATEQPTEHRTTRSPSRCQHKACCHDILGTPQTAL